MDQKYRPPTNDLCSDTLAVILAGGSGSRLGELTRWHAKPALPFGGHYRNIDFPLANCVNSGVRRVGLLTQYKAHSLIQHVQQGWSFLRPEVGEFIEVWPAQQRTGRSWYVGTADAVRQNIDLIEDHAPTYVLLLAGDHVYRMDYLPMLEAHKKTRAAVSVGCIEVPAGEASRYGVLCLDVEQRIVDFTEKPTCPKTLPGCDHLAWASMGIYVFNRDYLVAKLNEDARDTESSHDFGRDLLPKLIRERRTFAYPFRDARTGEPGYWRDVGTLDSYWQANMDLLGETPRLDLYEPGWPIWTHQQHVSPSQFCGAGYARDAIVDNGCRVAGAVHHSIVSTSAEVAPGSLVEDSVLLPGAKVGRDCCIYKTVVDSGCEVDAGTAIGYQRHADQERYHVSPGGVVLVSPDHDPHASELSRRRVA